MKQHDKGDPTYAELAIYIRDHARKMLKLRTNMTDRDIIDVDVSIEYGFLRWVEELREAGRITDELGGLHKTDTFYSDRPLVR